jgi:hypothetical protein
MRLKTIRKEWQKPDATEAGSNLLTYTSPLLTPQYFWVCIVEQHEALRRSTTGGRICGMEPNTLQCNPSPPAPNQMRRCRKV